MATADVTVYITKAGTEFELPLTVEGEVERGGSNRMGSDEPEWAEAHVSHMEGPNRRVSPRLFALLMAECGDEICEALVEADS